MIILMFCPTKGFLGGSNGKGSACNVGDLGSIPGLGRSLEGGNGNPLQDSYLENPTDRGAWQESAGSQRVRHDWANNTFTFTIIKDVTSLNNTKKSQIQKVMSLLYILQSLPFLKNKSWKVSYYQVHSSHTFASMVLSFLLISCLSLMCLFSSS